MKIAYTVWTWLLDPYNKFAKGETKELQKVQFEKAAREISFLGYKGMENFNILVETFEEDIESLKKILEKYHLDLTAIYTYLKADFENDKQMAERCIRMLNVIGCDILNLQGPKHAPGGTTKEDVLETARMAMIIGKMAYENDVKLCFHPHWGSTVEKEEEIEYFMANTDPKYVHLCLDTAHTQLMDMDPIKIVEKYFDRIAYMHFKDVDPDVTITPERPMNRFRALGQGTVDFKGVYKKLNDLGYYGTICVELDYPIICNFQSAQTSRRYLYEVLGI